MRFKKVETREACNFSIIRNLDYSKVQDFKEVRKEYFTHLSFLKGIVRTKDWQELLSKGISIRDSVQYRLHQLLAVQKDLSAAFDAEKNIKKKKVNLKSFKKQFAKGNKKKIFEKLKKSIFSLDLPYNEKNHMYVMLRNYRRLPDSFVLKHDYKPQLLRYARYLEAKRDSLIKIATLGMDAALFANFKLDRRYSKSKPVYKSEIKYAGEQVKQIDKTFENYLNLFYTSLVGKRWTKLKQECSTAREYLEEIKFKLAQLVVKQELYLEHLLKTRKVSKRDLKKINRQNLNASTLFRKLLLLYASANLFSFIANQQGRLNEGELEAKKAKRQRHKSMIPNGKDVSISSIIDNPRKYGKRLVEVEGFVQNLESKILKNRSKSKFELVESWLKNKIRVYTPSLNLARLGLLNGKYCRLNCFVKNDKKGPKLLIDRIELSKLSKKSWSDYLLDRVSNYYSYHPEEVNMKWTLGAPYRIYSQVERF